jgi:hypothetical protein
MQCGDWMNRRYEKKYKVLRPNDWVDQNSGDAEDGLWRNRGTATSEHSQRQNNKLFILGSARLRVNFVPVSKCTLNESWSRKPEIYYTQPRSTAIINGLFNHHNCRANYVYCVFSIYLSIRLVHKADTSLRHLSLGSIHGASKDAMRCPRCLRSQPPLCVLDAPTERQFASSVRHECPPIRQTLDHYSLGEQRNTQRSIAKILSLNSWTALPLSDPTRAPKTAYRYPNFRRLFDTIKASRKVQHRRQALIKGYACHPALFISGQSRTHITACKSIASSSGVAPCIHAAVAALNWGGIAAPC